MKRICIITSSRADYGLLKPLIQRLCEDADFDLSIVMTGMHLCAEFGNTYREIEADGFSINEKISIQAPGDSPGAMSKTMGNALYKFSEYFEKNKPDLLIVLGDRYEIMAVCCAAVNERIPIAHIHGGETTEGAVDECYRHSITKMSVLHFTSCEAYRKRVLQLGEQPDKVFNVGALGVENALNAPLLSIEALEKDLDFKLNDKPYGVVTFHPTTLENKSGISQIHELLSALDSFPDMRFIITKANSDAGGREINRILEEYCKKHDNCYITESLGMTRYLSAIKYADVIIGNSSSGILEGPAMKTPTVNIGDRQKGRVLADSVICAPPEHKCMTSAVKKALTPEFQVLVKYAENPFGNGKTSYMIYKILRDSLKEGLSVKKKFYDISNYE